MFVGLLVAPLGTTMVEFLLKCLIFGELHEDYKYTQEGISLVPFRPILNILPPLQLWYRTFQGRKLPCTDIRMVSGSGDGMHPLGEILPAEGNVESMNYHTNNSTRL